MGLSLFYCLFVICKDLLKFLKTDDSQLYAIELIKETEKEERLKKIREERDK